MRREKLISKIFGEPTRSDIEYKEVESLLLGLGFIKKEGNGSRIRFEFESISFFCHKPHKKGRKELCKAAIKDLQEVLSRKGELK